MRTMRCIGLLMAIFLGCVIGASAIQADVLTVDGSAKPAPALVGGFKMGTSTAPGGHTLTIDSRGLVRDGKPWVGISGEFHFSRCPEAEWRDELLKMKAGGVTIVTTYIFWIHHEEVEGVWDWTGQRDLRKFLETCEDVGMDVLLRVGPWCHGEVRNGGFPEWLQKKGDDNVFELRRDNPGYLGYVKTLYEQIALQMKGLQWKDGGPVIAIQVENEYSGPTQHLVTLKKMAQDAGMDVPMYTVTGWGAGGSAAFGELVPFSGAYADGFWDRSVAQGGIGYGNVFRFSGARGGNAAAMGAMGGGATPATEPVNTGSYPFFTCELGAGMMASYHRRVMIYPSDTESLVLVKAGSGCNLLGLYMYHGGENPEGKLGYLNETQATNYWNDLPVKNYDFQAPIGALGQEREQYHWLRQLGLFLQDYGSGLSGMAARMPAGGRGGMGWSVRTDGSSGYIFVSNYLRLTPQPARAGTQFQVKLAGGDVTVPSEGVTIPDNARFIWPLNLNLGGVNLVSASAQLICHVDDGNTRYTVFKQTAGVSPEFVFDGAATVDASTGKQSSENGKIYVQNVLPGLGAAIQVHGADGRKNVIILLDEAKALDLWKGQWQGQERLFLTHAALLIDGGALRLKAENAGDFSIGVLPAPGRVTDGKVDVAGKADGLFTRFTPTVAAAEELKAVVEKVQEAGALRTIKIAPSIAARKQGMAMQPEDGDFAAAAVWKVKLPAGVDASRDVRLSVRYTGDVLRAYSGDKLIADDFYAGRPLEIGLKRFGADVYKDGVVLKILPLQQDAPIYLTERSKVKFGADRTALSLDGVDVLETREVKLEAGK